ncbi:MAG: autotransporter outer membrane beta-barrel domain-containing protein, partial [Pseudomonas sp.]|uniref:autotransporter family protein n=1 Tax=Pseudomonas sp. TaxID=306 RepID=UPI003BB57456
GENGVIAGQVDQNASLTGGLINSGVIEARGANAAGVLLDAKAFVRAVLNSGTISADGVAIDARANDALENITQTSGLIEGGTAAIRANGKTDVNLSGGEIHGDLLGLAQLNATGGLIDSAHLEAQRFAVGHVELTQAHSQLTGNLELLGNSALDLNLSRQTDNQRAMLAVSGTATFTADDQIRLKATAQDFRLAGPRQYVLVSANQVIDQGAASEHGLSVTSLSDLLRVYSYQVSDTQITAMVGGIPTQEAVDYLRGQGASNHVLPAYGMFYGNVVSQLDNSDPVFQAFTSSNDQQLLALANQLAPDVSGALNQNQSSNLNLLGSTFQQRGNAQRQGLSAGDGLSETGAWLQVLNSDANQGSRSGTPGYDADSQGVLVGADGKLNESTTLGLAYSFINSDVHSTGNKTESDAQALSLYGNWEQNAWFSDASLTYGQADNDSRRTISSTRAKANFDSQLLGAELLGGYSFMPQPGLQLEPRVGARYNRVDIDSYHEKGSSAALAVSAQRYEVGELGAGLRLASELSLGAGQLKPELTLMAWHDLIADQVNSNSAFLAGGSAFVTNGSAPTRDSYQANIGVDYELGAITLGLGYDYLGKADYSADTFNAKVRYDF